MKRLDVDYENGCFYESEDGDFVYYEDVEDILRIKVQKLNLENGDILIVTPTEGMKWKPDHAQCYYELIRETFKKDYDNVMVVFTGDSKIEIKGVQV